MTKCEVALCPREAEWFQTTEGSRPHAYCSNHVQSHGGIKLDDLPHEKPVSRQSNSVKVNSSSSPMQADKPAPAPAQSAKKA